jgi:hypothetical protein
MATMVGHAGGPPFQAAAGWNAGCARIARPKNQPDSVAHEQLTYL